MRYKAIDGNVSPESARQQIEFIAGHFPKSQEAQYLRLGKWFSRDPLSAFERESLGILLHGIHDYKPGECYMNAGKIALARSALTFCEGFAAGLWPVAHAWVSYKGRAIDVTWPTSWTPRMIKPARTVETIMQRVDHNIKNCSYLGVEIPERVIRPHVLTLKQWSPLFDPMFAKNWPAYERALTEGGKYPTLSL